MRIVAIYSEDEEKVKELLEAITNISKLDSPKQYKYSTCYTSETIAIHHVKVFNFTKGLYVVPNIDELYVDSQLPIGIRTSILNAYDL